MTVRVRVTVRVAVRVRVTRARTDLAHGLGQLEHVRLHEEPAARRDVGGEGARLVASKRSGVRSKQSVVSGR